jgi:serine/threonine-protein phosphatase PGAM5
MRKYPSLVARVLLVFAVLLGWVAAARADQPAALFVRTIYLIRHGDYDRKEDRPDGGPLTALGLAQARLVAARLAGLPIKVDSITSSTMTRAEQTAAEIGQLFPTIELKRSASLRECTPATWRADIMKTTTPAETQAAQEQLDRAFAELFVPAAGSERHEIVVCHGNVIRYFVTKALGVDPKAWLGMALAHGSLTTIQVTPTGSFRVLGVGDSGHIPPNLTSGLTATLAPELVAK